MPRGPEGNPLLVPAEKAHVIDDGGRLPLFLRLAGSFGERRAARRPSRAQRGIGKRPVGELQLTNEPVRSAHAAVPELAAWLMPLR